MKKNKLHIIAPILSEISSKENGFKVPKNYFDTIESLIVSELDLQKIQLKNTALIFKTPTDYFDTVEAITITKLKAEALSTKEESNLPNDYFDTLEETVLAKLKAERKVISINSILKYIAPIAIAASLLLVFVLNTNKKAVTFDSLATNEIEQFIESGYANIDSESLATAFSAIELQTDDISTSLTETEVLDYLTTEDLEIIIFEN